MNNPLVTVIIPVYNVEEYLEVCLDSVLSQTYNRLEILCVLDGATDNSGEILQKYAAIDKRVKVIEQENQGLSAARNKGLDNTNGDFIYFLDSDDWLNETAIAKLVDAQKRSQCSIISGGISNYFETDKSYNPYKKRRTTGKINLSFDNFYKLEVVVWNKLYKKDVVGEIRFMRKLIHEDEDYYWKVFSSNPSVYAIPDTIIYYRRRKSSITVHAQIDKKEQEHYINIIDNAFNLSRARRDLHLQFVKCALKFYKRLKKKNLPYRDYAKHLKNNYQINNYLISYIFLKIKLFLEKLRYKNRAIHSLK